MDGLGLIDVPNGVDGYQNALSSAYFPMKLHQLDDTAPFRSAVATCSFGDICVTRAYASGRYCAQYNSMPQPRARSRLVLMVHEEGSEIAFKGGMNVQSNPGCITLLDSSRTMETEQMGPATALSIAFPAQLVTAMFPATENVVYRPVGADRGAAAMLRDFTASLWRERHFIERQDAPSLTSALVRMIGLAFQNVDDVPVMSSHAMNGHYLRLRKLIAMESTNSDLSIGLACKRLGISASYLQLILRKNGVTFRQLVTEQRLERCRDALSDPNLSHQSVTTIAFENGFQELSHFSRRFAERYGVSPRAFRNQKISELRGGELN